MKFCLTILAMHASQLYNSDFDSYITILLYGLGAVFYLQIK